MRRTIPRILLLVALVFTFMPAAGSAQIGTCSDDFCRNVPPDHLCHCEHCPVFVECSLRFTCPLESPEIGGPETSATTELSSARAEAGTVQTGTEPALERGELFRTLEALRPEPDLEGDAR